MTKEIKFDLAIIDADSLFYRIAAKNPSLALCKKFFESSIKEIMSTVEAPNGQVFIKGPNNFRFLVAADYKGNRKDSIEPEVREMIDKLYE